ncbi:UDP-glucosyltransferase 2-like [Aricia agestis]|uniref:UDP-glucosyltransferase 2-like n=1 Tax=Aricia agestis TaxID=91739 RepID=UPI001C20A058|nr:UDP-glucosyltransferase 2-like [Aricia agestis]
MWKKTLFARIIICLYWTTVDTARILVVVPTPSISHQVVVRPFVQELVKRGHEVTLITTDPSYETGKAPANLTEIDVHDISYQHFEDILLHHKGNPSEVLSQVIKFLKRLGSTLDLQLQSPEVQDILKKPESHFDILILEACNRAALGLSQKFKAPVILWSSFGVTPGYYSYLGAPSHSLLFPTLTRQRLYNLTRWEKFVEIARDILIDYLLESIEDEDLKIIRKHFGEDTDLKKLYKNIKLLLINEHPIWAENRPLPPNIRYVGGIHKTPDEEMTNELKSYLDASKNGVIYMSLGSNVLPSLLPKEKLEIIIKVFAKLPYNILLKWDDENIANQPRNVKVQKWFPQSTLLKHPNIKLFITQGGLQSTDEAINAGVPLLAIPMLGDQWYNAEKYVRHKIGLQINFESLDENNFLNAITTIITNESYKQNMLRLRSLMREHPIQPVDLAVWWTEHIIKYGGDHLIPPSAYLHWTEYYEVELVLICLCGALLTLCLLFYVSKLIFKTFVRFLKLNVKIKTKFEYRKLDAIKEDTRILHKHFGKNADLNELHKRIKLFLINEHPIWAENRPVSQNILFIGGIHKTPDEEMTEKLKSYLDASKNGVIYMSLGSNVLPSLLPKEKQEIITKVFAKLPYDILLKWDDERIANQPKNVKVKKWFPQSTLLKHPNIKLFITQGGLQSTDEAINAGVPLLAIPMLADQWYNAEKYVRHKIGLQLNIEALNENDFQNAITTIIADKSYKQNMLRLRSLMREHPIQPVDLAVWWTEHIIKYGGDHLIPPSAYLHWTEYYEVELVLICLGVTLATFYILAYISKIAFKSLKRRLKSMFVLKSKVH